MHPDAKFPRKLLTGGGPEETALRVDFNKWHVDPYCCLLWTSNRLRGRGDTFIGLLDTQSWTLYIAPCFGVTRREWQTKLHLADPPLHQLRMRFATCQDLPDDLVVVSGSTSVEADAARSLTWGDIRVISGRGACLVPWMDDDRKFDGHSHRVMALWIDNNPNINSKPGENWQGTALGFAIQRDREGYYVRFASGYNQYPWGAPREGDVNIRFAERSSHGKLLGYDEDRELRDLPKEWAMKFVEILARDLHLGRFPPPSPLDYSEAYFAKLVSRGEHALSKYKRLT
jgi:hypothetical protein